jgi:hypothetical protein
VIPVCLRQHDRSHEGNGRKICRGKREQEPQRASSRLGMRERRGQKRKACNSECEGTEEASVEGLRSWLGS